MAPKQTRLPSNLKRVNPQNIGLETPNPTIPSPLASLEVMKNWFENSYCIWEIDW